MGIQLSLRNKQLNYSTSLSTGDCSRSSQEECHSNLKHFEIFYYIQRSFSLPFRKFPLGTFDCELCAPITNGMFIHTDGGAGEVWVTP